MARLSADITGRHYERMPERMGSRVSRLLTSGQERDEAQLDASLHACEPPTRANVVAVTSPKGGVGKTACAYLLGATLAERSGLRMVVVDADHDVGTLALLVPDGARAAAGARQVLAALDSIDSAASLRPYLSVAPSGLHVLAGPFGPAERPSESVANLATLVALLERFYDVVVLDLGTGFSHPVIRSGLQRADHIVMVTGPEWVAARRVQAAVHRLLDPGGQVRLEPERLTLVLNRISDLDHAAALHEHFRQVGVRLDTWIPDDGQLATMLDTGTFTLGPLARETRMAVRELALTAATQLV